MAAAAAAAAAGRSRRGHGGGRKGQREGGKRTEDIARRKLYAVHSERRSGCEETESMRRPIKQKQRQRPTQQNTVFAMQRNNCCYNGPCLVWAHGLVKPCHQAQSVTYVFNAFVLIITLEYTVQVRLEEATERPKAGWLWH